MRDELVTRPLDPGRDRWFFRERWPLSAEVRAGIRPLDEESSHLVWNALIRRNQFVHPNQLPRDHWSRDTYRYGPNWVEVFNQLLAGTAPEPDPVTAFLRAVVPWPDELPLLFIEHRDDAIPATWGSFVSAWPHFISLSDEGPPVVSWERTEFLGFWPGGGFGIGLRGPADPSRRAMQPTRPRPAEDHLHREALRSSRSALSLSPIAR
jgi:hypothetical protein